MNHTRQRREEMITERARKVLSEGTTDNADRENTAMFSNDGEETTVFRLFRARHTAFDPEQEAPLWLRKARNLCTSPGEELRTGMVRSKHGEVTVMLMVSGRGTDARKAPTKIDDSGQLRALQPAR